MAFEYRVRGMAKSIYNKTKKIINEFGEDDYKYYSLGYFDYKDDKYSITYDYKNDEIDIICNHSVMNYKIIILKNRTAIRIDLDKRAIEYDSALKRMYKEVPERDKIFVDVSIETQNNLSESDKRRIEMMYEVAQRVMQKVEYNKEKTRTINNLNKDMKGIKNDYVLKRLELEGTNRFIPIEKAVDWLVNLIKNNENDIVVTDDQLDMFKYVLTNILISAMVDCDVDETVSIFYGGKIHDKECGVIDEKLIRALAFSNISVKTIPFGTKVVIGINSVKARKEKYDKLQTIYDNEQEIDLNDLKVLHDSNGEQYKIIASTGKYRKQLDECVRKSLKKDDN